MMSTFHNVSIILLILHALNPATCHNVVEPSEEDEDDLGKMVDEKEEEDKSLGKNRIWPQKESKRLETALTKSWQELDKMLFCTKLPFCVIRYFKKYRVGKKNMRMNLIQSISMKLHQIQEITTKIKALER